MAGSAGAQCVDGLGAEWLLDVVLLRLACFGCSRCGDQENVCSMQGNLAWCLSLYSSKRNTTPLVWDCGLATGSRNMEYNQLCQWRSSGSSSQESGPKNDISALFNLLVFVILDDLTLNSPMARCKSTLFILNPMAATLKGLSDAVGVKGTVQKDAHQNAGPCSCKCMKTVPKLVKEDDNSACCQLLFLMMHQAAEGKKNCFYRWCLCSTRGPLLYNSQDSLHKISFKLAQLSCFPFPFVSFLFYVLLFSLKPHPPPPHPHHHQPPPPGSYHIKQGTGRSGGSTKMTELKTTELVRTFATYGFNDNGSTTITSIRSTVYAWGGETVCPSVRRTMWTIIVSGNAKLKLEVTRKQTQLCMFFLVLFFFLPFEDWF